MVEILIVFGIWGTVCYMIGFGHGSKSMIKYVTKHLEKIITPEQFMLLLMSIDKDGKSKTGE